MQVKVQTVSELTINQLSDDQYLAEKAAGRINAGEVYACTPSPVKWEDIQGKPNVSGGGDVDYQELARRIPTWQWKVTMPKTVNQTVTATVGGQTYTSDFYAHLINHGEEYQLNYILTIRSDGVTQADVSDPFDKPGYSDAPLTASWSSEINKHAVDYDWTK